MSNNMRVTPQIRVTHAANERVTIKSKQRHKAVSNRQLVDECVQAVNQANSEQNEGKRLGYK